MSEGRRIVHLRLYVAGHAPNSTRALANLRRLLQEHLPDQNHLEIINVLEDPQRALAEGVLITPTLVRVSPGPIMYVMGDLSETARVLAVLTVD